MSPRRSPAIPASTSEAGPFLTRRRVVRWAILLFLAVLLFLACWQDPVYATPGAEPVPTAVPVRMADVDTPTAGHASVTALLIVTGVVTLLFTAITLATLRRRP
ncbi:hypothetical protein [Catenuloplanes atrovinosus]|uniref:Formate-dependent nitrite reductase membrane component NrfD n=1 Tax=Catenuloplanes atrovinosus TaxID=137266 RepID=A0AAE3YKQ3_9ACTN|nr:hypothetical protein [Catenuloplanes atrovinosus]MDR7274081.1 formate-dependent nitrite reductase membrane component NrfD [Catenuloplanes atrovinosus]